MNPSRIFNLLLINCLLFSTVIVRGSETPDQEYEIRFEKHQFTPKILVIPAGRQVEIRVVNSSAERIEFESFKLNREKVVEPGQTLTMKVRPLPAGSYDFFDDFHADVPEGEIVAR
jgi:hypothetical protein